MRQYAEEREKCTWRIAIGKLNQNDYGLAFVVIFLSTRMTMFMVVVVLCVGGHLFFVILSSWALRFFVITHLFWAPLKS